MARPETGAALLLVHHTGKPHQDRPQLLERGSSALRAAADVMISVTEDRELVRISNDKQKDDDEFAAFRAQRLVIDLGTDEATGRPQSSCVLVKTDKEPSAALNLISPGEQQAADVLAGLGSAKAGKWRAAISEKCGKELSPKTFDNWRRALLKRHLIELVPGTLHTYQLTATANKTAANGAEGNAA